MKIVNNEERSPMQRIDYSKLADLYNRLENGGAVEMDEQVYNITLFKKHLARRGVVIGTDFEAFNRDGKTVVKRLTQVAMTKD